VNSSGKTSLLVFSLLLAAKGLAALEIGVDTQWAGDMVVSEEIAVAPRATLKIMPASRIVFKGGGAIVCDGKLSAEDALFLADPGLSPGISILGHGQMEFSYCVFKDFVNGGSRYNVFMRTLKGKMSIKGCRLENCAAVEFLYSAGTVAGCLFKDSVGVALHLYHADNSKVGGSTFWGGPRTSCLLQLYASDRCATTNCHLYGALTGLSLGFGSKGNLFNALNIHEPIIGVSLQGREVRGNLFQRLTVSRCKSTAVRLDSAGDGNCFVNCAIYGSGVYAVNAIGAEATSFVGSVFMGNKNLLCSKPADLPFFRRNMLWQNGADGEALKLLNARSGDNVIADPMSSAPDNAVSMPQAGDGKITIEPPK